VLGFSTFEVCQVRNAFFAVELGKPDINCDGSEDDPDLDNDGFPFGQDNCPSVFKPHAEGYRRRRQRQCL